jgi:uncharacterized protein YuzE
MKIEYDPKHDILNFELISEGAILDSIELNGIIIDYANDGRIVAIEILDAGKRTIENPLELLDLKIIKEKTVALN